MKLLLILLPLVVALIAAIATIAVIGMFIPRNHKATRSARFAVAPERVWAVISDFEGGQSWRPGVKKIERLPDRNGKSCWRETSGFGVMTMVVESMDPPRKMVTRIDDPDLPFGGTWTWEVAPEDGASRVRITEDGFIKPPPFRYMARLMGYDGTMKRFLKALGKKMGQEQTATEP